ERRRALALRRLAAMQAYATGRGCRRRALMRWFGEWLPRCTGCDRCPAPRAAAPRLGVHAPQLEGGSPLRACLGVSRAAVAAAAGLPRADGLPDAVPDAIAAARPASRRALGLGPGFGPRAMARFGEAVLALVRREGEGS